ncbi:hypothetical protein PRZ61_10590 [Halomonas pacifica]|uniref:hypothetical protein n=1 Tax=Bisbaumannia pacifica TaxID=77098 RepID=UPI0023593BC0|nr:hypothetical protein [Halomonas pacifica]MDC8803882.1 hypothetical protein [Halomonas pacifica]
MTIDIDKLEALARAASDGEWTPCEDGSAVICIQGEGAHLIGPPGSPEQSANTQFIAATSPDVILALVARLRESERREQALAAHVERLTKAPATYEILEEIHRRASKEWGDQGHDFTVTITGEEYAAFEAEQESLLSDAPTNSLVLLIAEKQAEELERIERYDERAGIDYLGGFLQARIHELRRQAEAAKAGEGE